MGQKRWVKFRKIKRVASGGKIENTMQECIAIYFLMVQLPVKIGASLRSLLCSFKIFVPPQNKK